MSEVTPSPEATATESSEPATKPLSPLRCILGAVVAGVIAYALYNMTSSIAHTFALKPIHTSNYLVQRIGSAVRTLVIGLSAMGTGIFSFAALGLLGLGIQLFIKKITGSAPTSTEADS